MLYAIFVSPLFDLAKITNFADNNFVIVWNKHINCLIVDMEKELKMMVKWLMDLSLQVNTSKTEACLFHRNDHPTISITLMGDLISTKKSMNV